MIRQSLRLADQIALGRPKHLKRGAGRCRTTYAAAALAAVGTEAIVFRIWEAIW